MMQSPTLVCGLVGCGVVGGGVLSILKDFSNDIFIKKICVKDVNKEREDVEIPPHTQLVTDYHSILDDPEINCVIELVGGLGVAKEVIFGALRGSKHVVTGNKSLISKYMDDIEKILQEKKGTVSFQYETAVCGGIPIVNAVKRGFSGDKVTKIIGIMNGTTNYMLCEMENTHVTFQEALENAQKKGFAESDPSADILGWDARSKLCILAKLAFGLTIDEDYILCEGITKLKQVDFEYANMLNRTIRLLGICELVKDKDNEDAIQLSVSPVLISKDTLMGQVIGVTNAIEITSKNLGVSWYGGAGAGRFPSANSAAADVLDLMLRMKNVDGNSKVSLPEAFPNTACVAAVDKNFESDFFVRFFVDDKVGVIQIISSAFAKYNISIFSILQLPIQDHKNVPFVVITQKVRVEQIQKLIKELQDQRNEKYNFINDEPVFLRYM